MIVHILHNIDPEGRFWKYEPGQALARVHTYDETVHRFEEKDPEARDLAYCEHAFHLFNAPEEYLYGRDREICEEYRSKRLRSLSVGDVVILEDEQDRTLRAYACEHIGFERITDEPNVVPTP